MPDRLTLGKILDAAIQKEIESQRLYMQLSAMVGKPPASDALEALCREEKVHQDRLERYRAGKLKGALSKDQIVDYHIAELAEGPDVSPNMQLKDAFLLAANREKASHELYVTLAAIHPDGEVKSLLLQLAGQELEHKQKVESLYTQVAYPQTDGG